MADWTEKRILIIGAARQGLALARYLARHGAVVTLNDQRAADRMAAARQSLAGVPVRWVLGEHPLDLLDDTDLVCLSGGVPLTLPIVAEAARRGLPLSNDSQIFMELVPAAVTGITGSAGKTTTTTLVGRMAQAHAAASGVRAWVGGNIGQPLIDFVDEMQPEDLVVMEISSFQLEQMTISPRVGAVLNITPNHLDRHGTLEAYAAAKARILAFQNVSDCAVLNREDPGSWGLRGMVNGQLISFGFSGLERGQAGTFLAGEQVCLQNQDNQITDVLPRGDVLLRGDHNLMNVLAACAIAAASGYSVDAMRAGVRDFRGVAHRLEFVAHRGGADWYNDSIATAPERTAAAIRSFSEPLVLLLGGRDKNLPWSELAELIHSRVDHVVVFGEAAGLILAALGEPRQDERPYSVTRAAGLEEAVRQAANVAGEGDVVLLSPGGTSFDEFKDFEERGERFRLWVQELE